MGLAASQARLLSITQRISDNELRAQLINNQKMRLSADSAKVSENYINALNKTNLIFANYDSQDKAQNVPLTFNNLTAFNQYNNQYGLTNAAGNILISESEAKIYQGSADLAEYLKSHGIEYTTSYWDKISEQLEGVEDFHATPNYDGEVTAEDGAYSFYSADQLKEMYEGFVYKKDENGEDVKSTYLETIKTSEYTDFVGYVDNYTKMQSLIERAEGQRSGLMGKFVQANLNNAMSVINSITNSDINTEANQNALFTKINEALEKDFRPGGKPEDSLFQNVPDTFEPKLTKTWAEMFGKFTYQGGNWTTSQSLADFYGHSVNNTSVSPTYNANSLYVQVAGVTYVQVPASIYGQNGNETLWAKPGDSNVYEYKNGAMQAYSYTEKPDGSDEEQTITPSVSVTGSSSTGMSFGVSEGSNSTSYFIPQVGSGSTVSASFDTNQFIKIVKDTLIKEISNITLNALGAGAKINQAKVQGDFTTDEIKTLANTVVDEATMNAIINGLNSLAFKDDAQIHQTVTDKNGSTISDVTTTTLPDSRAINAFLDFVTSGKWQRNGDGTLQDIDLTYKDASGNTVRLQIPASSIKDDFVPVVNAYILDTLQDVFGEPVYTYLYTDGNGKVVDGNKTDASAEAEWYTNLYNKIKSSGYQMLPNGLASSTEWMQFALENGIVIMEQVNSSKEWQAITYTSCSDINEQTVTSDATIAEAEYNKAMRQIQAKDELFDLELKNIDTEHSALQNEYESVKKAMTGNIERTFQMYS